MMQRFEDAAGGEVEALAETDLTELLGPGVGRYQGKVRDNYLLPDGRRVLVATDRISAFDRVLGLVPWRGQVLNQLSAWWFEQTRDLVDNHLLEVPDPNVMVVRQAEALPVEVIVRGYITGVTSTSLWTLYEQGVERPYGLELPQGLQKNDPLPEPVITPTTKATGGAHDERVTRAELLERGLVAPALWEQIEEAALGLYAMGARLAREGGLILVDTKYEFGLIDGQLVLIDEVHTPDCSRFWLAESWEADRGSPEHVDKEFMRLWYAEQGYRGEGEPPALGVELTLEIAGRYAWVYEALTGQNFEPGPAPVEARIGENMGRWRAGAAG